MDKIRLQKFISDCGYTSRRKAEELIKNGKVKVNDVTVCTLGTKINEVEDEVSINGKIIQSIDKKIYIKLNKPIGYITTVKDQFNRPCVIDLIDLNDRIYPIGRLDYNTSGLLLLTNDGMLTNKLTHPKYKVYKTYIVKINGKIKLKDLDRLRSGVDIGNYVTAQSKVKLLNFQNNKSIIELSIHEGKNRQIRRMLDCLGYKVIELERISFGNIKLDNLKRGKWKHLSSWEVEYINKIGG